MHSYKLITERFQLLPPEIADLPDITVHADNKKIADGLMSIPYPFTKADASDWFFSHKNKVQRGNQITFTIKGHDFEFVGIIGLSIHQQYNHAEVGYWIAEKNWGQGAATECLNAIIKFGFERLDLHKIFGTHFLSNRASSQVMRKCGMVKEGELKDHYRKDGEYHSIIQYRITQDEYEAIKSQ